MRTRRRTTAVLGIFVGSWLGCARGPYVTYAREEGVLGYRVEYVEAMPKPGTPVPEGGRQAFAVTVNYMLIAREKGSLVLEFTDGRGRPILDEATVSLPITRTRMQPATITQEVRIPGGLLDVVLHVGVVPEGEHRPGRWIKIRYPTTTSK